MKRGLSNPIGSLPDHVVGRELGIGEQQRVFEAPVCSKFRFSDSPSGLQCSPPGESLARCLIDQRCQVTLRTPPASPPHGYSACAVFYAL
jgi:hypothetical protein